MKLTYLGSDERVLPTLGITVKPGDEIDAPEEFAHPDFVAGGAKSKSTIKPSASSDIKAGE